MTANWFPYFIIFFSSYNSSYKKDSVLNHQIPSVKKALYVKLCSCQFKIFLTIFEHWHNNNQTERDFSGYKEEDFFLIFVLEFLIAKVALSTLQNNSVQISLQISLQCLLSGVIPPQVQPLLLSLEWRMVVGSNHTKNNQLKCQVLCTLFIFHWTEQNIAIYKTYINHKAAWGQFFTFHFPFLFFLPDLSCFTMSTHASSDTTGQRE